MTDDSIGAAAPQPRWLTATFYRFVPLPDAMAWRERLLRECAARQISGTIVLAQEGINGTIAGSPRAVHAWLDWLRSADPRLARLRCLVAPSLQLPLRRLKVQLKPEIVKLGVDGIDPRGQAGVAVPPGQWNRLLARNDVVVIDVRNDFEVALGSFIGAVDPQTRRFSDLPGWIEQQRAEGGVLAAKPAVAMFCTGGIRCEKATALLRSQGFDEVFQLAGGILAYLATVAAQDSRWHGECFVFDERISVGHGAREHRGVFPCPQCGCAAPPRARDLLVPATPAPCVRCASAAAVSPAASVD